MFQLSYKSCIPQTCDRQSSGRLPGWSDHMYTSNHYARSRYSRIELSWTAIILTSASLRIVCGTPDLPIYHCAIRRLKKDEVYVSVLPTLCLMMRGATFGLKLRDRRSLPVFDLICRRSINFAPDCILHESGLIN